MFNFPSFYGPNYYFARSNKKLKPTSYDITNKTNFFYDIDRSSFNNTYFNKNCFNTNQNIENNNINTKSTNENNSKNNFEQNYFLELFGIRLYLDDLLIITIIFFLYQEGIRDDELFITLILLLLG